MKSNHNSYNILIVEDHPIIISSYISALEILESKDPNFMFTKHTANNCEIGYQKIRNSLNSKKFDLIILDIQLPSNKENKMLSGEDLGITAREILKDVKIMVITNYDDNLRLSSILRNVNPDAFMVKSDLTPENLVEAFRSVFIDPPYYSKTLRKLQRKITSSDINLDNIDRLILYELSIGSKMSELPQLVNLSMTAIERRRRIMKELFGVSKKSDRYLLLAAREKGFI